MSIAIGAPTSRELSPTSRVYIAMPSGGACTRDGYAGQMVMSLNALCEQDFCRITDLAVKELEYFTRFLRYPDTIVFSFSMSCQI